MPITTSFIQPDGFRPQRSNQRAGVPGLYRALQEAGSPAHYPQMGALQERSDIERKINNMIKNYVIIS